MITLPNLQKKILKPILAVSKSRLKKDESFFKTTILLRLILGVNKNFITHPYVLY